jgi:hypothetical protein
MPTEATSQAQGSSNQDRRLRIFLSYRHDNNEELVRRIEADLEKRGHDVWFDKNEIKFGDDFPRAITDGILHSQHLVAFLSKHSTGDSRARHAEIAIAMGVKGSRIHTGFVKSEAEAKARTGISHLLWPVYWTGASSLTLSDWPVRPLETHIVSSPISSQKRQ